MSESTSSAVECPVCGEEFDPTDAGGWCTNSDCGEWQYIGEEVPEPAETTDGDASVTISKETAAAHAADDTAADAPEDPDDATTDTAADTDETPPDASDDEPTPAIRSIDEAAEPTSAEDPADAENGVAETPDQDDDTGAEEAHPAADGTDDSAEPAEAAGAEAPEAGADDADAEDLTCPDCGTAVDQDDSFCADCGADLSAVPAPSLDECPSCGEAVADDDSFCASCGNDLEAARASLGDDAGDSGAEGTGAGGDESAERAEETDASPDGEAPDSLVLHLEGEEITVTDDETVGREVRRILTQIGANDDDAVRIHREHVRFVREDDRFYLVDLGDNPTVLNGRYLSKGDREPVGPGDELELSDVATISIEAP